MSKLISIGDELDSKLTIIRKEIGSDANPASYAKSIEHVAIHGWSNE